MKILRYLTSTCIMILFLPLYMAGQGVIVSSGIYMRMTGGTLVLHGDWVNNGSWADTNSRIFLNDTTQQHIGGSSFTEFDDLTINNSKGVIASCDLAIEGVLNLQSANASDTTGTLDMGANTLIMDSSATTIGQGDVSGIVKRVSFVAYKEYSFGNQFATVSLYPGGTYPTEIKVKIRIGKAPSWKPSAIMRIYDLIQMGGVNCWATVATHYLDNELNGNAEEDLVIWANGTPGPPPGLNEFGRSNINLTEDWVSLSNIDISSFPSVFGQLETVLAMSEIAFYEWNGSQSTTWSILENWTPNGIPSSISNVIIPDTIFSIYSPILPDSAEIGTINIEQYGVLNSGTNSHLYVFGSSNAWSDEGTFNSSTGSIIFKGEAATISGTTNFYNVIIDTLASLRVTSGNVMRIAGAITNKGIWHAVIGDTTTVEYNGGDQTVVIPNSATSRYSNLILSGSGTKTMPDTTLNINGDFSEAGTVSATAAATLAFKGNFTIGSDATFNTGTYNHTIGGNITNNGTFAASGSTITCNGNLAQTIGGTAATTFDNLISNNAADVTLASNALTTVSGTLKINSGKKLSVAPGKQLSAVGAITNNAGISGFVLQSGPTGTASLLHNTDNVPVTVQRYISGDVEAWHFISSPVANQSISGSWRPSGSYGNGTGYDLYLWNEPSSCWIYSLNTTSAINWNTVHPGSNFIPGRGYLYSVQAINPTKAFSGNLNNGPVEYSITYGSTDAGLKGFNFTGNPYPSAIDWQASAGWSRSNLVSSGGGYDMWIWNPAANNYGVCNSGTGICTNSVTRYIPPTQGFFVQASSDGSLGMDNALRLHNDGTWFKNTEINPGIFKVMVESETDKSFDEVDLLFGYSENEPGARKLFSSVVTAPSLYMSAANEFYSVRYLTDTTDNPKVPVMFKPGREGNFTLSCNFGVDNFETVTLEDTKMKYTQDLKIKKTYSFNASKSDDANRFVLHFGTGETANTTKLPARIYADGKQLIIDLTAVNSETDVLVYDALGRVLLHKTLEGFTLQKLNIFTSPQILVVLLKNKQGSLCQKLFYKN